MKKIVILLLVIQQTMYGSNKKEPFIFSIQNCPKNTVSDDEFCLDAWVKKDLIGAIIFRKVSSSSTGKLDTMRIQSLIVHEKKHGVGTALINAAQAVTQCEIITLNSIRQSVPFYVRLGFFCNADNECIKYGTQKINFFALNHASKVTFSHSQKMNDCILKHLKEAFL